MDFSNVQIKSNKCMHKHNVFIYSSMVYWFVYMYMELSEMVFVLNDINNIRDNIPFNRLQYAVTKLFHSS